MKKSRVWPVLFICLNLVAAWAWLELGGLLACVIAGDPFWYKSRRVRTSSS